MRRLPKIDAKEILAQMNGDASPAPLPIASVEEKPGEIIVDNVQNIYISSDALEPKHTQAYIELWANMMVLEAVGLGGVVVEE